MSEVSIVIVTYNRLAELQETLNSLKQYLEVGIPILVCDDNSTDGTSEFVQKNFSDIQLFTNKENRGYLYSRNKLLNSARTPFVISLDDDANFLSCDPINLVKDFFTRHPSCGVLAFRIFWGKDEPESTITQVRKIHQVKGFVGCGHAWRIKAWQDVPNYPEWFEFYGEEEFSSFHLLKEGWKVYYNPEILIHHRVNIRERKDKPDYERRLRRSLRSGWYLYLLFLPWKQIPRKLAYSVAMQFKLKIFKGDFKAFKALLKASLDVIKNFRNIKRDRSPLTRKELEVYGRLPETNIYWKPE